MPVPMTRPWKHPKTGVYWLRKRVPNDLHGLIGKREEKRSLQTKDAAEAKQLLLRALSELEARWANLRKGPQVLSEREAHEIAQGVHDWWIGTYGDNPSEQVRWSTAIGAELWSASHTFDSGRSLGESVMADVRDQLKKDPQQKWCLAQASELLTARGLVVDDDSRLKLAKAVGAAMQRASLALERMAAGELLGVPLSLQRPAASHTALVSLRSAYVGLDAIFDDWEKERNPAKKTLYEWKRVIQGAETISRS